MNTSVLNRVQRVFADVFSLTTEEIKLASSPETIQNWDSLQHLNLVLAIEQEFDVQFTPEEIEQLTSIQDIMVVLDGKLYTTRSS